MACDSVNTIYSATFLNHGAMFDLVALADITLDHLAGNVKNGTFNYFIYYKNGSFVGAEGDPFAWTLIDSAMVTSVNNGSTISNQPTVIPISLNLSMLAGDTIGLYVTAPAQSSVQVTSTTIPWATEYSADANLSVSVARTIYKFHGTPFSTPQIWNGSVSYCDGGSVGVQDISTNDNKTFSVYSSGNTLQLHLEESIVGEYPQLNFQIMDLPGKTLINSSVSASWSNINISEVPTGIYICTLRSGKKIIEVKKVMLN